MAILTAEQEKKYSSVKWRCLDYFHGYCKELPDFLEFPTQVGTLEPLLFVQGSCKNKHESCPNYVSCQQEMVKYKKEILNEEPAHYVSPEEMDIRKKTCGIGIRKQENMIVDSRQQEIEKFFSGNSDNI